MATQIGVVKALIGEVTATAADGSIRTLQLGDMVYANELISTGEGGAIEIQFADGSVMDLGRNSQAMLDSALFDPNATSVAETVTDENVPDDVAAIQQALLEGDDPTQVGEATAAGAGTQTGNEGHSAEFVDYLNPEVTPTAGFDTVGVENTYDLPEEDIIIVDDALPTLSINDVTVVEPDGGFFGGGSGNYNIIYILDVSGSMGSGTRLADMQQAIISLNQQIIDAGIADDTEIAIIPFSSGIDGGGVRAPTFYTSADLDANNNGVNDIEEYINALYASGGTNFTPPLEVAEDWLDGTLDGIVRYEDSNNIIFFISDGVGNFDVNDPDIQALYDSSTIDAQIISIGISEGADLTILDSVDDQDGTNDSAIQVLNTSDLESVLTELVQAGGGEGGSTSGSVIVEFTVTLSEPSDVDVTVDFTTANGTAISGGSGVAENDYGSTSGTVTIPAGSTSATIQITVYDDNVTEFTEQYLIKLGNPVNAEIADDTGVGTILDNDPVDFAISSTPSISEDDEETATFTVTMDGILADGVTASVQLDLGAGTATDAVDYDAFEQAIVDAAALQAGVSYNASTNTLTFNNNFSGSFDFTVDAINDQDVEGTENIVAELSNASVTGGYGVATISVPSTSTDITENDINVSFAIDSTPSISEDAEETATFSVTMSGGPLAAGETATVDIALGTQTATDGVDYDAFLAAVSAAAALENGVSYSAGTLTFDSTFDGQFDFTVDAIDDVEVEDTETIVGTLSNATVSNGTASITVPSTTTNITENEIIEYPGGLAYTIAGKGNTGAFLYSIDLESGIATELGPVIVDGEDKLVFTGLAMDPTSDTLYGFGSQGSLQYIAEVNPVNGEVINFWDVSATMSGSALTGAAFAADGTYYVIQQNVVYEFNGSGLDPIFSISGGLQIDGFSIDPATGDMYFAINNGSVTDLYVLESADIPVSNTPVAISLVGTVSGELPDGTTGDASVDSLAFDNYGNLWGADNDGTLIKINPEDASIEGGTTLANNEVTGSGVYSLGIAITEDQVFEGGTGNDIITGGSGSDLLTGGDGDDLFVWTSSDDIDLYENNDPNVPSDGIARDVITDFEYDPGTEVDTLDLSDLLIDEENSLDDLTGYIHIVIAPDDSVVLEVTPTGEGEHSQEIYLAGATSTDLGIDSFNLATPEGQQSAIETLIANGSLNVDQS